MTATPTAPATEAPSGRLAGAETLLRDEFLQAWEHYRHSEAIRGQYLNHAFSVSLVGIAAAIPLAESIGQNAGRALLAGTLVLMYAVLIAFSLVAVVKIRAVTDHYADVWLSVREYFYRQVPDFAFETERLNVWKSHKGLLHKPAFRLQNWAESILLVLSFLAVAASASLTLGVKSILGTGWRLWIMGGIAAATVVITILCMTVVLLQRRVVPEWADRPA